MTPSELKEARLRLGLSQSELGRRLQYEGDPGRTVRRQEAGEAAITGPVRVAIAYMLREHEEHADKSRRGR